MSKIIKIIIAIAVFSIAMAFVEAAVVIYLRALYYPSGFSVSPADLKIFPDNVLKIEFWREIATIFMLADVAFLAFPRPRGKLLGFLWAFSIWDLFYYLFLFLIIRWPESISTLDVYFLVPRPLIGPVWLPLVIFSITAVMSCALLI